MEITVYRPSKMSTKKCLFELFFTSHPVFTLHPVYDVDGINILPVIEVLASDNGSFYIRKFSYYAFYSFGMENEKN